MPKKLPTVAIVGRPNVGKSTLFNRITGVQQAITSKVEGTTRDRVFGKADWNGKYFNLIDTGGYIPRSDDMIEATVRRQAEVAIEQADLIVLVVDAETGITAIDQDLADQLHDQASRTMVVVNKVDSDTKALAVHEFWNLGLGEPVPTSAATGRQTGDMLDALVERLEAAEIPEDVEDNAIQLAVVGMPNVGKSSYVNAVLQEEMSIVTDIPGTTRDTVHSEFAYFNRRYRLIDTAGLRKRSKISEEIEYYSTLRTYQAIDNCSVALLIIDAVKGFTSQDAGIVRDVLDKKKGLVITINKWDLVEKTTDTAKHFVDEIVYRYPELQYYPITFISAKTRLRLFKPIQQIAEVYDERGRSIKTRELNNYFQPIWDHSPPAQIGGKYLKIKYVTQVKSGPPVFALFVNNPRLMPENYRRFLERKIRERWGFTGVPITLSFREKRTETKT